MAAMKRLLQITADDYGYSSERNRAIVECYQRGVVTQTSLMVTAAAAQEAARLAQTHGITTGTCTMTGCIVY